MATVIFSTIVNSDNGVDAEQITVKNEEELKSAVSQPNVSVLMANDIPIDDPLLLEKQGVTIDGDGHTLSCYWDHDGPLLEVKADGCALTDITLNCCNVAKGISIYKAKNVTLESVEIKKSATNALTVDMSEVNIATELVMNDNGDKPNYFVSTGNYIELKWTDSEYDGKCSVSFDDDHPLNAFDRLNLAIGPNSLVNAGVTPDNWDTKFIVKHGSYNFPGSVYGTEGNETVLINNGIASVGEERFATLRDAVTKAMVSSKIVGLTQDCMGGGFELPDGHGSLQIDLNGYKYILMDPEGAPMCNDINFKFGKGDEVSFVNGTIDAVNTEIFTIIETKCDMMFRDLTIDGTHIMHDEQPFSTDIFALSVDDATCILDNVIIECKAKTNINNSFVLENGATLLIKNGITTVTGDSIIRGGSQMIVESGYEQLWAVMGKSSYVNMSEGSSLYIKAGAYLYASIKGDSCNNVIQTQNLSAIVDSIITSEMTANGKTMPMSIHGSFCSRTDEGAQLLIENYYSTFDLPVLVDIIVGDNVFVSLNTLTTISGNVVMGLGSEVTMGSDFSLTKESAGSHFILMDGSKYNDEIISGNHIYKIGSDGTYAEQIRATFINDIRVDSYSYCGAAVDYIEAPMSDGSLKIDLSKITLKINGAYKLTGWVIDGVSYGTIGEVCVTENCVIVPVLVSDDGSTSGSDDNALRIIVVALIAALVMVFVADFRR